jgi:two-component system response regulator NreC
MATTSIRVLVCDDHALVRSGLRRLLESEPSFGVVGEAADAEQAVETVGELRPDVLLLDVVMPGRSGIEALPDLRSASPDTRVLVLSMQDDPSYVRQAFAAGADGYLVKEAADADLVQAIRDVASGHRYVHPSLGARLAALDAAAHERAESDPLSEREHEVLRLLALGHTNQEIAKLLYISVRTAESHRARIMQKLRLSSRAELVRYALASGVLELERARSA